MKLRLALVSASIIFLVSQAATATSHNCAQCKNTPSSPGWPSYQDWSQLNTTTGGHLLAPLPPAIVCDPSHGHYSASKCASVGEQWLMATFHDNDPVSLHQPNWQDDACLPTAVYNKSLACSVQPFPKYTVNASDVQHVVDAVKFASKHNLRVSVKNTGHDYLGRSTSPEFSIWTHYLKGIQLSDTFRVSCPNASSLPAMTISAGNQLGEVYDVALKHGILVVGGADPSVGLGGYLTGGGHSPIGAMHGLAADNVLEMQVVLPSGELVTANECSNQDLFWAMRGGGGSTFGVLTSATVKTYPNYPAANFTIFFQSTDEDADHNNNTAFQNLLADLYESLVDWSDNYINGYMTFGSATLLGGTNPRAGRFSFGGWGNNMTVERLNEIMEPFTNKLNTTAGIQGYMTSQGLSKISDVWGTGDSTSSAGSNAVITSRLWPKEALTNRTGLIETLRAGFGFFQQGLLVSGPAVRSSTVNISATPAWRRAYIHQISGTGWAFRNAQEAAQGKYNDTYLLGQPLRDLAPNSGCYLNEANVYEPNRPKAFWGYNYAGLLRLKRDLDPNGTFWCLPCVGSEDWIFDPQTNQLCRRSS